MDRALYAKGHRIAAQGRVKVVDEAERRIYLEVEGSHDTYGVRLERDHTFACTCPYATLKGLPKGALCSHAVAAIIHLSQVSDEQSGST